MKGIKPDELCGIGSVQLLQMRNAENEIKIRKEKNRNKKQLFMHKLRKYQTFPIDCSVQKDKNIFKYYK